MLMNGSGGRFSLYRNGVTIFGAALATTGAVLFLLFFLLELFGYHGNPYMGMLFFLVLPGVFVAGLAIIPLGVWLERRQRAAGKEAWQWPVLDFADPAQRRAVAAFSALTVVNVLIVGVAAYKGVEYMDSPRFCGQLCHEVMEPEWTGYQENAHSRVACVQCHIGPGAPWFVKSKLSGLRQVYAVTFNTHSRPIPSPVHDLRPARDTCEQCHWPEKFHGDMVKTIQTYNDDEANTESVTTLRMHVGGTRMAAGRASGIHWHVSQQNRIEYVTTDDARQTIPWVKLIDAKGREVVYRKAGVSDADLARGERRTLDCVDCHNRPAHTFALSAERAVDDALAAGAIDRALPFVRREAVAVLKTSYPTRDAALSGIAAGLTGYYRTNHPGVSQDAVRQAVATAQGLYTRNVFPTMKVTWGSYVNNLGHEAFPGCFRCHDGEHVGPEGKTISQDCSLCHEME
jgi:nitrate/TMAO reductase-like tetraheme cytochrome c subunit